MICISLKGPHIVHPFLQVAEIAQASERVYTGEDPTATDLFITNMIFAIGGVFSRSTEEQKQPNLGKVWKQSSAFYWY
jgi:hypothetical protein